MDVTANCILVTNRRLVKIEKGRELETVDLIDVAKAEHGETQPGRYEKLVVGTLDGKTVVFGIWSKEVTMFLASALSKIAQGNTHKLPPELLQAKKERASHKATREDKRSERDVDVKSDGKSVTITGKDGVTRTMTEAEAEVLRQRKGEDEQLDILIGLLDTAHAQALDINSQLKYQDKLLDHLDEQVGTTTERLKKNSRKVDKIIKK